MTVVAAVAVLLVVLGLRRRARRRRELAGLEATRPVFSAAPPVARLSKLRGERL